MKKILIILILISTLLFWNCSSTFTITMIDNDDRIPIPEIESLIIDDNGKDILIENIKTDTNGKLHLDLSRIPGDSFMVSIKSAKYFDKEEWVTPFTGVKKKDIYLNQRMTTITGVVLDDSSYAGVANCNVSTSPKIMKTTKTDSSGFFKLRSKQFANIQYVIHFNKPPEYESNSTNVKPILNEIKLLEVPILLARKKSSSSIILDGTTNPRPPEGPDPPVDNTSGHSTEENEEGSP